MTPLKHTRDHKMGIDSSIAIWHADANMQALVEDIYAKVQLVRFVETGTHMGWTAHWVANHYPNVALHTVEMMADYYELAKENLACLQNVNQSLGDSRTFLRALVDMPGTSLFWLDAHWYKDHPLRGECEILARRSEPHLILIDDYHCGPDFGGDTASPPMVEETLGKDYWRPNYAYQTGFSGYALFVRGVDYTPPGTMRRNLG
jgi:hypothetical protein